MPNDIAVARYVPPVSVPDLERMANAVVQSGLFGIKSVPQAMTLMLIAQAEGRHPVIAARDYDIIQAGNTVRPAKKTEAMMRDFLANHGTVEWHELSDAVAEATFSHPAGGSVRIRWDMERARQAGIGAKDNWKKYPRPMLRSRCVSEGVRTVCPMATSGMYVPEEVADFAPPKERKMKDVTPKADIAAPDPEVSNQTEIIDTETGEILDHEALLSQARAVAEEGWVILSAHLKGLTDEAYEILKPYVGTKGHPGELRQIAAEADGKAVAEHVAERGTMAEALDDAIPF